MASSSRGWVTEPSVSESESDIPVMEAVRTGEILPEVASGVFPTTAKVSSMEPAGISIAIVAETISLLISSPLSNTLTICKQSFLDIIIPCFNEVLLQVFRLWVHRLQGNQHFPGEFREETSTSAAADAAELDSCITTCPLTSLGLPVNLR